MQYAIINGKKRLCAIIDIPQGQKFTWTGPDEMEALVAESFEIDGSRDFDDYEWNGEKFVLTAEAVDRDSQAQVAMADGETVEQMVERLVAAKLAELNVG